MSQKTKYLVELETGVGWRGKKGEAYPVFTGHRWCKNKKEALSVALQLMRGKPLFHVRIRREVVISTFVDACYDCPKFVRGEL